jgi:hypothetical protein
LAIVAVGAALLSFATAATLVQCLVRRELTYWAIAGSVASLTCFCSVVATIFWIEGTQADLARVSGTTSIPVGKLDRLCQSAETKATPVVAGFLYREHGVCIAYQAEDDSLRRFEPTNEDQQKRARRLELQRESLRLQGTFERQARFARAAGFVHVGALPVALVSCLVWAKRRKRELTN